MLPPGPHLRSVNHLYLVPTRLPCSLCHAVSSPAQLDSYSETVSVVLVNVCADLHVCPGLSGGACLTPEAVLALLIV